MNLARPKRLIYGMLPIRTTYDQLVIKKPLYVHDEFRPTVTVLLRSISGLALLSTCRKIAEDTRTILHSESDSIRAQSDQILANYNALGSKKLHHFVHHLFEPVSSVIEELEEPQCESY